MPFSWCSTPWPSTGRTFPSPETFFIDGDGTIVEHVNGPLDKAALAQLLDVLVGRDP
ncbi:MAG: hypothetical protein M3360_09115 [Actinomycetota bacterium]|nr:hypothetical protein [Actinomycetota bacterium]